MNLAEVTRDLPKTGGRDGWKVMVKSVYMDGVEHVSVPRIIGPGDRFVGIVTGYRTYMPSGQVTYWHIVQMRDAGWAEEGLLDQERQSGIEQFQMEDR